MRTERVDDSLAQIFFLFWHSKVMPEVQKSPPKAESLSLSEMMRIMDVATEIRTQRETIEKEFAVDETKRLLREKLLKTTAITGERVTEAEVDAAIEAYFMFGEQLTWVQILGMCVTAAGVAMIMRRSI